MKKENLYQLPVAEVYPYYVKKVESKGRTVEELTRVITWLTGYDEAQLTERLENRTNFRTFFAEAPEMNPAAEKITGVICGVRIEEIDDPLMKNIRRMDKLIDELAKGKKMEKILRV